MIPPILHRVAIGTPPESAERWWAGFARLHPDWTLMTHTPEPEKFPRTAPYWKKCVKVAQQADLMRYEVLQKYGGIYVDWDVEPYQPLDPFLGLQAFLACEAYNRAGNAVMGFEKGHPALEEILKLSINVVKSGTKDIFQGGPVGVSKVCFGRKDVLILPAGSFFQMGFEDRLKARDGIYGFPWVYGVHRINASWLSPTRKTQLDQVTNPSPEMKQGYLSKIAAVIPTRFHPKQLEPLLDVLRGDDVYTILLESEDFGHELHKMWNEGVRRAKEYGCSTVAILNDDITIVPGTLAFMEKVLRSNPVIGCVCADSSLASGGRPHLPPGIRVALNQEAIRWTGFAFLYDPNDPDAMTFPEEFHIWQGDIKFFEAWRKAGRAVASAVGLKIVHEGNHSIRKLMGETAYHERGPMRERVKRAIARGQEDAVPLLEDLYLGGTGLGHPAKDQPLPGRRYSWELAHRQRR